MDNDNDNDDEVFGKGLNLSQMQWIADFHLMDYRLYCVL